MSLSFVAIDFETANPQRASVCAVGLTSVVDGTVVSAESWLIEPPTGLRFTNTFVHGIGPQHVVGAARWPETARRIESIAAGRPLVAYSAFDKSVYDAANTMTGTPDPGLTFLDALQVARGHCDLASHRLPLVAAHLGLPAFSHHDAGADALACASIVLRIADEVGAATVAELWASAPAVAPVSGGPRWTTTRKADLPQPSVEADPDHPLYGEVVCFSGDLGSYSRPEAQRVVASLGATVSNGVTKKTTLVVMGGFDASRLRAGESLSSKVVRAQALAASGQSIEIVTEKAFLELVARP